MQCYEMFEKVRNDSKTYCQFRTYLYDNSGKNVYSGGLRVYVGKESFYETNNS